MQLEWVIVGMEMESRLVVVQYKCARMSHSSATWNIWVWMYGNETSSCFWFLNWLDVRQASE